MADIEIPKVVTQSESSLVRAADKNLKNQNANKNGSNVSAVPLKGSVRKKELTFGEKLKNSFVKDDVATIRDYIIFDLVIPNTKRYIFDIVVGSFAQALGIPFRGSSIGTGQSLGYSPHEKKYRDYTSIQVGNNRLQQTKGSDLYNRHRINDVLFTERQDAEAVLEYMIDICDSNNNWLTVAQFYEIVRIPEGVHHTNVNYGWTSEQLGKAGIIFDGSGYFINLPQAQARRL